MIQQTGVKHNRPGAPFLPVVGALSAAIYLGLALAGDLLARLPLFLALHALLLGGMFAARAWVSRRSDGMKIVVAGAVLFRLIVAFAPPTLSDDVYRYVWDGRVQLAGTHPYRHAPSAEELAPLRDDVWERVNHPEVKTIYPPLAQMLFLALAAIGAGPIGFKLAFALADLAVLALVARLLAALDLPRERLVWYAWNPLAVMETAGSGHLEPAAVAFLLLAVVWLCGPRAGWSSLPFACAVQMKLLPLAWLPGALRRWRTRWVLLFAAALVVLTLPYAIRGPAVGAGLFDFAERWERNASVYRGVEGALERLDTGARLIPWVAEAQRRIELPQRVWTFAYEHVWPRELARGLVAAAALAWVVALSFRRGLTAPREVYLALGGVLVLAPIVHPWYVLWILPFAAAFASPAGLAFAALVPLAYLDAGGDVPWLVRAVEYGVPLAIGALAWRSRRRRGRVTMRP